MGGSGVKKDAFANSGTANAMQSGLYGNATANYNALAPQLQNEIAHPQGYTPQQQASFNTAAQQSAGGSNAGAVGQGALLAARTRNAGAAQNAIQQSGRQASENLSDSALHTQMANANLQQKQSQAGMSGLESLYGTNLSGAENALQLSNGALNTANNAQPSFWQQMAQKAGGNLVNAGLDSAEGFAGF